MAIDQNAFELYPREHCKDGKQCYCKTIKNKAFMSKNILPILYLCGLSGHSVLVVTVLECRKFGHNNLPPSGINLNEHALSMCILQSLWAPTTERCASPLERSSNLKLPTSLLLAFREIGRELAPELSERASEAAEQLQGRDDLVQSLLDFNLLKCCC